MIDVLTLWHIAGAVIDAALIVVFFGSIIFACLVFAFLAIAGSHRD